MTVGCIHDDNTGRVTDKSSRIQTEYQVNGQKDVKGNEYFKEGP